MSENSSQSTKPKPKVIVFDFDGTLVNSMGGFADMAAQILVDNYDQDRDWALRRYRETSGLPFCFQLEELFPGDARNQAANEKFCRQKIEYYRDSMFFEGLTDLLSWIKAQGMGMAVSSNNEQEILVRKVEELDAGFDLVLGFQPDFFKGKDHFGRILDHFKVSHEDLLFMGDSLHDGKMALENKVRFVAKAGTFPAEAFVEQGVAEKVIYDLPELMGWLEG